MNKLMTSLTAVLLASAMLLTGCSAFSGIDESQNSPEVSAVQPATDHTDSVQPAKDHTGPVRSGSSDASASAARAVSSEVDEDWTGDDKDGVALYLETYDRLPSNYMTKKEARSRGWEGGALHLVIPGRCIGGDSFGNYEGLLPEDGDYRECDIDTLRSDSRGAKRIIYTDEPDDLDIWYTSDHYESFTLIYGDGR